MQNLIYLLVVLAVSAVGIGAMVFLNRRPNSLESGIDEFNARMRALAPPEEGDPADRRSPPRPPAE